MTEDDEIQIDDVGADIRAAAESLGAKLSSTEVASPPADPVEAPESSAERPRDASGKFLPKTAVEQPDAPAKEITDAVQPTEQPQERSQASLTPPRGWSAEEKAQWAALPPAIQAAVSRREEQFSQGAQQWTVERREVEQTLSPLHELSQANGFDWKEGLNRLLDVESKLRNPQTSTDMVAQLISAYPVDFNRLTGLLNGTQQPQRVAQPQFDPNVITQTVKQQIAEELENRAAQSEISSFKNAKDANGKLLYPHFEAAQGAMKVLLLNDQATSLPDAYEKAIWMNPEMRPQPQIQVSSQQQIQKAKNARVSVNGAPVNGVTKPKGFDANQSLTDDIREAAAMVARH